jgi:hypothetical protein
MVTVCLWHNLARLLPMLVLAAVVVYKYFIQKKLKIFLFLPFITFSMSLITNDYINPILKKLLVISIPNQFVVSESKQTIISNLIWQDIFDHIKSEHWHTCGKFTSPHSESLYDHLLSCANICYTKAQSLGYSDKECIKAYLTGLLHDIGKPGSRCMHGKHTSFKGHGLIGGGLIENFYSPELTDTFDLTSTDWADISTCADVHMCSYFPKQTSDMHKYSVMKIEPWKVDWNSRLSKMSSTFDDSINTLYGIVVGFHN